MATAVLLAAIALSGASCTNVPVIEEKPLAGNNPTSYVFEVPYANVLGAVDELCRRDGRTSGIETPTSRQVYGCNRWSESRADRPSDPRRFYYTSHYHPDASYDSIGVFTAAFDSRSYFADGKPLRVRVQFRLELYRIDERKTRVSATAVRLEAFNGTIPAMHGGTARNIAHLPATSIEEYELLLYLGSLLGDKNMPRVVLP